MKNILIHGLGQNEQSWNDVNKYLKENQIDVICPNLFSQAMSQANMLACPLDYKMMYNAFSDLCNTQKEKLNLCGLSLGGIVALDYAKEYTKKVNSIILIGTPYKIPKSLFKLQSIIFHIMPKSAFEKMGCSKEEFITFVHSMSNLDISRDLDRINCPSLIVCGAKDNANMKSAKLLNKDIKNSKFKVINNSAHEVNIDNPKELANVIYDFWKDNQ